MTTEQKIVKATQLDERIKVLEERGKATEKLLNSLKREKRNLLK